MTNSILKKLLFVFGLYDIYQVSYRVRIKQVELIYKQTSVYIILAEWLTLSMICITIWDLKSHILLISWLSYIYLTGLIRLALSYFYLKKNNEYSNDTFIKLFGVGTFLAALGWGAFGMFLMPDRNILYQAMIVMVVLGDISVANSILAPILAIFTLYLSAAFIPLMVWLFVQGGVYSLLGVMSCCYYIVMICSAFYTNKLILTSLILSFINKDHALNEQRLNDELLVASRLAGMTDIASSLLHNVGNVITSANASIQMIYDKVVSSKISNLEALSKLFQEHQDHIKEFLTSDPKGLRIPSYLISLSEYWSDDKKYIMNELNSLISNMNHVKDVISKQNDLGMSLGFLQEVNGSEVFEDALRLNQLICEQSRVSVIRDFLPSKTIKLDRVKLLQILVNLIKNAIDSLIESKNTNKYLTLRIVERNDSFIEFVVEDNGIGISPENMKQIFHQRFTSKKKGHGFGLHSSILAAREMNGTLEVISEGLEKGAVFTLRLPFE